MDLREIETHLPYDRDTLRGLVNTALKEEFFFSGTCRRVARQNSTDVTEEIPHPTSTLVRWRRHIPPKRRLIFNGLHDVISQKKELVITRVVKASNHLVMILQGY
jgi:hypothetical protein